MNFSENLRLAWSCVRANKMRSILTMLGIIIGISAVITISTIGSSLRETIQKTFSDLTGTNQLAVYWMSDSYDFDDEESPSFTLEDVDAYKKAFDGMVSSAFFSDYTVVDQVKYEDGDNKANVSVIGFVEGYAMQNNLDILMGRDINYQDNIDNRKVCMVSDHFVKYGLGGIKNPIGQRIEINTPDGYVIGMYIIGVYKQKDNGMALLGQSKVKEEDKVTNVIIPIKYAWNIYNVPEEDQNSWVLYFMNEPGVDVELLKTNTISYFERRTKDPGDYRLRIESLEEQLKQINNVLNIITVAISVIAAISLIVGGIGVMNIMLVSVVERTKEIGIRKALGAKNKVIEMQFLVEAVMICAIGSVIGILIGLLNGGIISFVIKQIVQHNEAMSMLSVTVSPPIMAILVSFFFSSLVGVVFGLYPARRAARLSPIDALRYE